MLMEHEEDVLQVHMVKVPRHYVQYLWGLVLQCANSVVKLSQANDGHYCKLLQQIVRRAFHC